MNHKLMKTFKLLVIQFGSKGVIGYSCSSQSEENKTMVSIFYQEQDPIIYPMTFREHQGPLHLNFLYPNNILTFNLNLLQWKKNGINLMNIVKKVYHLISTFLLQTNSKIRKIINLYKKTKN